MSNYVVCPGCHRLVIENRGFCDYCGTSFANDESHEIENNHELCISPSWKTEEKTETKNPEVAVNKIIEFENIASKKDYLYTKDEKSENTIIVNNVSDLLEKVNVVSSDNLTSNYIKPQKEKSQFESVASGSSEEKVSKLNGWVLVLIVLVFSSLVIFELSNTGKNVGTSTGSSNYNSQQTGSYNNIQMPDVAGLYLDDAISILVNKGIVNYSVHYEESARYSDGYVIRTYPSFKTAISDSTNVAIYVSDGSSTNNNYNSLYQIQISDKVKGFINMRSSTSAKNKGNIIGSVYPYEIYDVFETKSAEGYTWYRIGNNKWIANDGTWINRVYNISLISSCDSFSIQVIDDEIGIYDKPNNDRTRFSNVGYGTILTVRNCFYDGDYYWYEIDRGQWVKEKNYGERVIPR